MPCPHPVPSPCPEDLYNHLVELLHPDPPTLQEIAILPSSSHPNLLHDPSSTPPAVGIPQNLLLTAFLHARTLFFAATKANEPAASSATPTTAPSPTSQAQIFQATTIILLWAPNHLTAINWRKSHLLNLLRSPLSTSNNKNNTTHPNPPPNSPLQTEMTHLRTLLTSPLPQHAKSETLWAHRWWLVTQVQKQEQSRLLSEHHSGTVLAPLTTQDGRGGMGKETEVERQLLQQLQQQREQWLKDELQVVMQAAERHARNYHAWEYARRVVVRFGGGEEGEGAEDGPGRGEGVTALPVEGSVDIIHRWCLAHPRDISGWAFLVFLLRVVEGERMADVEKGVRKRVVEETREFAKKFGWRGESVGWFLEAVKGWEEGKRIHIVDRIA